MEKSNPQSNQSSQISEGQVVEIPAQTNSMQSVQPTLNSPQTLPKTQTSSNSVTPKKKTSCLIWCLSCFGIFVLIIICCVIAGFTSSSWLPSVFKSTSTLNNFNKSDYSNIDVQALNAPDDSLKNKINNLQRSNPNSPIVVTITEKELLTAILSQDADLRKISNGFYLKFENNNKASLRAELSTVLKLTDDQNLKPEDFKDIYIGVDMSVGNDGKSIIIDKITSGNEILDNLIAEQVKTDLQKEINKRYKEENTVTGDDNYVIDVIKITNGQLMLTFKSNNK